MNPPTETFPPADASVPAPPDELISRHFDEALPPEEHGRLESLLKSDPQVVMDFVATARLHQGLEAMGPVPVLAAKSRKIVLLRRAGVAGAAAALLAVGVWSIFVRTAETGPKSRIIVSDILPQPPAPADSPHPETKGPAKRIVEAAGATSLTQQPELEELLSRYYVNVSPQGLTVSEALKQLSPAVRDVNYLNRPALNQLSFSVGASIEPDKEDPVIRTPLTAPMTVKSYLETCGLYRQVTRQPGNVVYGGEPVSLSSADEGRGFVTRIFRVPPDFLSARRQTGPEKIPTAKEVLSNKYGIELAETETASFSANSSRLVVRASLDRLDLLGRRIEAGFTVKIPQVFVTTKIMIVPEPCLPSGFAPQSGIILNDMEYQMYMRKLSITKGVNLFTAPSIISRIDQRSEVQILRESPLPRRNPDGQVIAGEYDFFNTGLTIPISTICTGELMQATGSVQFNLLAGMVCLDLPGVGQELAESVPDDGVGHVYPTEFEIWTSDRDTAMFTLDVPLPAGRVAVAAITRTTIVPQGQPLRPQSRSQDDNQKEPPYGIPVPGKPGFVTSPFSTDGEVDVTGIPSGTKVRCPYTRGIFRAP